jgi:hypothetical protein
MRKMLKRAQEVAMVLRCRAGENGVEFVQDATETMRKTVLKFVRNLRKIVVKPKSRHSRVKRDE